MSAESHAIQQAAAEFIRDRHQLGAFVTGLLSPFPSKTSWTCGSIVRDDDLRTFTQPPRSAVSHHAVDACLFGEGGLGGWPTSTGGPL
jgi:hypothetical protein